MLSYYSMWAMLHVSAATLPTQLPGNTPGKAVKLAPVLGPLHLMWENQMFRLWFSSGLASAVCSHLGNEPVDEDQSIPPLSTPPPITVFRISN